MKGRSVKGGIDIDYLVPAIIVLMIFVIGIFILYIPLKLGDREDIKFVDEGLNADAMRDLRVFVNEHSELIIKARNTKDQRELERVAREYFNDIYEDQFKGWKLIVRNSNGLIALQPIDVRALEALPSVSLIIPKSKCSDPT